MNPPADPPSDRLGMSLPLAMLGLAVWQAFPTLIEAWSHDLYARGAPLAFAIWIATQGWLFFKNRHLPAPASVAWLAASMMLCTAGAMSGLRVLHHLALACAVAGLPGRHARATVAPLFTPAAALTKLTILGITAVTVLAWLPASGWLLSHWRAGGLGGWERPALAALMALFLLTLSRASAPPPAPAP